MKLQIIEANARRNGNIIINGWKLEGFENLEIVGSEKQLSWCEEILAGAIGEAVESVGKKLGLVQNSCTTEDNWAELEPKVEDFVAQVSAKLKGANAKAIIDGRGSLKAIMANL